MKHSFAHGLRSGLCLMLALLLVLSAPATALAAAKDDYCSGYDTAVKTVETAQSFVTAGNKIVEIIETLISDYSDYFKGSDTDDFILGVAEDIIADKLAEGTYDSLMTTLGYKPGNQADIDALAGGLIDAACVYYDTANAQGGTVAAAQKATVLSIIEFVLKDRQNKTPEEAAELAKEYYEYSTMTDAKALETALDKYAKKHSFKDGKCSSCGTKAPETPESTDPTESAPPETTQPPCAHSYGSVKWTWSDDASSAYITKRCAICDDVVKSNATITTKVVKASTCTAEGTTEYTGTASMDGKEYTHIKTVTTKALGHNFDMKWTWDGTTAATVSYTCKNDKNHTGTATATITSATTDPTCTADGKTVYTATVTIEGVAYTDTKTEAIKTTGHTYDAENASWSWSGTRSATVTLRCSVCRSTTRGRATITNEVTTAPTCIAEGVRTYTATATINEVAYTDTKTEAIPMVDHTFADGKCSVCGEADPDYVAPPTEPPVTEPPHTHNYSAKVTKPTCTEKGYTTYTCSCGDSYTADEVAATGHTFGEWVIVKDPTSKEVGKEERACACGEKETREIPKLTGSFADVKATDYYYEPVLWAVNKGITAGTSATTFGPATPCTRAQVVTFLWRAAGSPEPKATSTTFTDVKAGDYYYKAVLWAVEEGITSGMSATSFGSASICTRAQVVTFLWRAAGSPEAKNTTSTFTDVKSSDYYCKAVLWAVENGITAGMSATSFGSANNCSRGQIVTFLYKAYVK